VSHSSCPRCNNTEHNTTVWQCGNCSRICCSKCATTHTPLLFGSEYATCPVCGSKCTSLGRVQSEPKPPQTPPLQSHIPPQASGQRGSGGGGKKGRASAFDMPGSFHGLSLGVKKTPQEYLDAFQDAKVWAMYQAEDLIRKVKCEQTEKKVNLIVSSPCFFGPKSTYYSESRNEIVETWWKYDEFCSKVLSEGNCSLCPPEVGLALRLHYRNQRRNSRLYIAMEPIKKEGGYADGEIFVLGCERGNDPYLVQEPTWNFEPEDPFVFIIR
jgi:hypothetical protein